MKKLFIILPLVLVLCFLGGYPLKYLFSMVGVGIVFAGMFLFVLFKAPDVLPDRAGTWKSRIETFIHPEQADKDDLHQLTLAQIAIAEGGIVGKGAGKSVMKNLLSQSTSDFIFAIIIEGAAGLILGASILFPKTYSRLTSFKIGMKDGVKILISTFPFTITAGFLEGYVTRYSNTMPNWLSVGIIIVTLSIISFYYLIYPYLLHKKLKQTYAVI